MVNLKMENTMEKVIPNSLYRFNIEIYKLIGTLYHRNGILKFKGLFTKNKIADGEGNILKKYIFDESQFNHRHFIF